MWQLILVLVLALAAGITLGLLLGKKPVPA
jgi:uncharacterized protein YneF (UPF0154 family)